MLLGSEPHDSLCPLCCIATSSVWGFCAPGRRYNIVLNVCGRGQQQNNFVTGLLWNLCIRTLVPQGGVVGYVTPMPNFRLQRIIELP
jgi:hypothetical protein